MQTRIKTKHDNKVDKCHSSLFLPLLGFFSHAIPYKINILRARGEDIKQGGYRTASHTSYATADSLDSESRLEKRVRHQPLICCVHICAFSPLACHVLLYQMRDKIT